jgi:hypothetical protein
MEYAKAATAHATLLCDFADEGFSASLRAVPRSATHRQERPCKGHVMALWRQAARLAIREKGAFCGFLARTARRVFRNLGADGETIHRYLGFLHRESTGLCGSEGGRILASTSIAERLKKEPHPTLTRGAGRLHRPRFPDARERRRKSGGGA